MPASYPDWDTLPAPRTHTGACVTRWRQVRHARIIRVQQATYRGSGFDGIFELVEGRPQPDGKGRYEVYCAWFGVKPNTQFPTLAVAEGRWAIESDYSGKVADNLSV